MNRMLAALLVLLGGSAMARGQASDAGKVWDTLAAPAMDPTKYAVTENVRIVCDRVHITLVSGTIQFAKPANGVAFAAVFHGEGHVFVDPPNPIEAQQLKLFTRQEKLSVIFTDATFTFSDGLLEEVEKQVKWKDGPGGDDLYAKRQQGREDIGGEYLPRIFKSVMSPDRKRTAYFLADLKLKDRGWIEVRDDAMQPEEIRVGRWADVGPFKLEDYWMIFPAGGRDPRHVYDDPAEREDFLLPSYKINAFVTDGAELGATASVTVSPRYTGERFDATKRAGNPEPDPIDGFFPGAREFAPVVGPSRGMEELPRPVAFGGIRRVLRTSLCAIPPEYEGGFNAMAAGQRTPE